MLKKCAPLVLTLALGLALGALFVDFDAFKQTLDRAPLLQSVFRLPKTPHAWAKTGLQDPTTAICEMLSNAEIQTLVQELVQSPEIDLHALSDAVLRQVLDSPELSLALSDQRFSEFARTALVETAQNIDFRPLLQEALDSNEFKDILREVLSSQEFRQMFEQMASQALAQYVPALSPTP